MTSDKFSGNRRVSFSGHWSLLEWLHWLGLWNFMTALLAGATRVICPEILHRLAEMLDDIGTIEIDVFDQGAAIVAIENDVLVFARRAAFFHDHTNGVRRANRRMRHIRWNEERFAFAHKMIDDLVAFADAHFDIALELIKILLRVDLVEIVSRVRALDNHHEKVPPVVEITIADWWFEFFAVRFDPIFQINRQLNGGCGAFFCR